MKTSSSFFSTSAGISRELFVEAYGDVARISQLMIAPLGVGYQANAANVLGVEKAQEEYMKLFRRWEEVVSRSVYASKNIAEDRVAASMHLFLEVRKDHVVMESIRREAANVNAMILPPSVVSMLEVVEVDATEIEKYHNLRKIYGIDEGKVKEVADKDAWILGDLDASSLNLNTPGVTAHLMKRVLTAIKTVFDGLEATSLPPSWAQKYGSKSASGLSVREYHFSPHDISLLRVREDQQGAMNTQLLVDTTNMGAKFGMPASAIEAMVTCLRLQCPAAATCKSVIPVTVLQYLALLDIFGEDPLIEETLNSCFNMPQEGDPEDASDELRLSTLDIIRIGGRKHLLESPFSGGGGLSTTLAFSAPYSPLSSFLTQLSWSASPEQEQEREDERETLEMGARIIIASQELITAQSKAEQSTSPTEAGAILNKALRKASSVVLGAGGGHGEGTDGEEDMSEEEEEAVLLSLAEAVPDPLLSAVLSALASYITTSYANSLQEIMTYGGQLPPGESEDPAESPSLRRALRLSELAIEKRPYDGRGYEARSAITSLLGQRELEEAEVGLLYVDGDVDGGNISASSNRGSKYLRAAAKDALAAFHLGGSNDLSLAGSAEDACRQASRLAAKMHYCEKMNNIRAVAGAKGSEGNLGARDDDEVDMDMPRVWFVQAYLCGYEPPSLAMAVPVLAGGVADGQHVDCAYLSLQGVSSPYKLRGAGTGADPGTAGMPLQLDDIDLDDDPRSVEDAFARQLPMPPRSFLRAPSQHSEGEGVGVPGTGRVLVGRKLDRQAFHLLRHLVTLLEASMISGMQEKRETTLDGAGGDKKGMERFVEEAVLLDSEEGAEVHVPLVKKPASDGDSFLSDLLGSDAQLIAHGVCSADNAPMQEQEQEHEQEEGEGEAQAEAGALESGEKSSHVCPHFREVARILHTAEARRFTGVSFDARTHLVEAVSTAEEQQEVSAPIRARLLNVCSMAAYLLGDAEGAVSCLRASLEAAPLMQEPSESEGSLDPCGLIDSAIKLGALLCDMDERKEAGELLSAAISAAETASHMEAITEVPDVGDAESEDDEGYRYRPGSDIVLPTRGPTGYVGCQAVAMLHLAELAIHRMELDEAQSTLQKANRLVARFVRDGSEGSALHERVRSRFSAQLETNVTSLLGVVLFRKSPEEPDDALRLLKRACNLSPDSLYLHLSYGEVLGQAGDLAGSLACFHQAHEADPTHPLPFVNAARTYQQLNQSGTARRHLDKALLLDPSFSLTYIDVAQAALQAGKTEEALQILDKALLLARHVSDLLDVLTARRVAELQLCLEEEGLYHPPAPV